VLNIYETFHLGNGKTVIKGSFGLFGDTMGDLYSNAFNPNASASQTYAWTGPCVTTDFRNNTFNNTSCDVSADFLGSLPTRTPVSATGGLNSIQNVSNFRFAYTTPPTLAVNNAGANVLITWPVSVSTLFVLQQSSSITGPWANVGTAPTIVNLQNQISVPNSGAKFYRLMLQ